MLTLAGAEAQTAHTGRAPASNATQGVAGHAQVAQAARSFTFNIPPKPLPQALTDVSMTTGMQILYTGEQFFNLTSQPVIGTYSLEQALQLLLAGTGLTYRYTEANTVTLERVTTPTSPSTQRAQTPSADPPAQRSQTSPAKQRPEDAPTGSGIVLPDVTVQGMRPRASAWRPVRGYVATRSATGTKTERLSGNLPALSCVY